MLIEGGNQAIGAVLAAAVKGVEATSLALSGGKMLGNAAEGGMTGSIRNVNPGYGQVGRTQNCVNCSIATDATLSGHATSALPSAGPVSLRVLETHYGSSFGSASTTNDIAQQLLSAGNGARGIVFGSRGAGNVGHVFNVVNQNGIIRFLDGQTGKVANLNGYTSFHLLRTN